ncbi:MAG: tetratricopeptide repeat protein [Saprospiraceae bacterium]|nr:tetratricopeptide repeat protein [Lewinella sp.]
MDKASAIAGIRAKLVEGDIEAALQLLIENLEPDRRQLRELSNRALQAKAQLEKTQRDEQQGVISFDNSKLNYNQITQQVLSIVDDWETPTTQTVSAKPTRKIRPQMIIVAVLMIAVIGVIGFRMIKKRSGGGSGTANIEGCPRFEKNARFNILVLPFYMIRGEVESPHRNLARRLDDFKKQIQDKIATSVRYKDEPAPELDDEAILDGKECQAKLVIWGGVEAVDSPPNGAIVTTKYRYLLPKDVDAFTFTKFDLDDNISVAGHSETSSIATQGSFVETISNYTSITQEGSLSKDLENQIRLLFGIANMQSGNPQAALDLLEKAEVQDSSSTLLRDMAIAESHIQMNDTAKAVEAYDRALATHPNYWFALNNRALIYYQKGDYAETLKNLDQKLEDEPDNVEALTIRGAVRTKTKQFSEAEEDLMKARELDTKKEHAPYIDKKLQVLEREKRTEILRRDQAISKLNDNRNDITALTDLAETTRNLGEYEKADRAASRLLNLDPENPQALAVKAEVATKLAPRSRETTQIIQKVDNLSPEIKSELFQDRPLLKAIIEQRQ